MKTGMGQYTGQLSRDTEGDSLRKQDQDSILVSFLEILNGTFCGTFNETELSADFLGILSWTSCESPDRYIVPFSRNTKLDILV